MLMVVVRHDFNPSESTAYFCLFRGQNPLKWLPVCDTASFLALSSIDQVFIYRGGSGTTLLKGPDHSSARLVPDF